MLLPTAAKDCSAGLLLGPAPPGPPRPAFLLAPPMGAPPRRRIYAVRRAAPLCGRVQAPAAWPYAGAKTALAQRGGLDLMRRQRLCLQGRRWMTPSTGPRR